MVKLEESVRSIVKDGLVWGASTVRIHLQESLGRRRIGLSSKTDDFSTFPSLSIQLVAIGYGVKKLQITLVITDDVSLDEIQEECSEFEDYIQSTE